MDNCGDALGTLNGLRSPRPQVVAAMVDSRSTYKDAGLPVSSSYPLDAAQT
jgi:hypothetical protein